MALTSADVRNAEPLKKDYKLHDEKGLYLLVETSGIRTWKFSYRFDGRNKVITLGPCPEVSLTFARQLRDEARELIADGTDPITRCEKREVFSPSVETFEAVAQDWLERVYRFEVSEEQFRRTKRQMENYLIASIGKRVVSEVTPEDLKSLAAALGAQLVTTEKDAFPMPHISQRTHIQAAQLMPAEGGTEDVLATAPQS